MPAGDCGQRTGSARPRRLAAGHRRAARGIRLSCRACPIYIMYRRRRAGCVEARVRAVPRLSGRQPRRYGSPSASVGLRATSPCGSPSGDTMPACCGFPRALRGRGHRDTRRGLSASLRRKAHTSLNTTLPRYRAYHRGQTRSARSAPPGARQASTCGQSVGSLGMIQADTPQSNRHSNSLRGRRIPTPPRSASGKSSPPSHSTSGNSSPRLDTRH